MREKLRETWHERGVREYSAGIERCFRSLCHCDRSHLANYSQLWRQEGPARSCDCTAFWGNYCLEDCDRIAAGGAVMVAVDQTSFGILETQIAGPIDEELHRLGQ